jgi:GT2 family glycosyltransferase
MKITLWVPRNSPQGSWACYSSWWNLETPDNIKMRLIPGGIDSPEISWNQAVKDFLDSGDDWLLSWHNDVIGDPQTLMRLLSWDKPIVSALVFMRTNPVLPHIWHKTGAIAGGPELYAHWIRNTREWFYAHQEYIKFGPLVMDPRPDDALTQVGFTSTSCMLIHRTVLEAMREEVKDLWFKRDGPGAGGEDRNFCEHARKAGFETYVDRSCVVGHLVGDVPTGVADFIAWDSISTFNGTGEPAEKV